MVPLEQFKKLLVETVATVVSYMAEKVRLAEENGRNPFINRTNIYRTQDGRPICFCCLRVGHVAKYCWHREYSCRHTKVADNFKKIEPSVFHDQSYFVPVASLDIAELEKETPDFGSKLNELKKIVQELELEGLPPSSTKELITKSNNYFDLDEAKNSASLANFIHQNDVLCTGHIVNVIHSGGLNMLKHTKEEEFFVFGHVD